MRSGFDRGVYRHLIGLSLNLAMQPVGCVLLTQKLVRLTDFLMDANNFVTAFLNTLVITD